MTGPSQTMGTPFNKPWLSYEAQVALLIRCSMLRKSPTLSDFCDRWCRKTHDLLDDPPATPNAQLLMGLTDDWKNHRYWR